MNLERLRSLIFEASILQRELADKMGISLSSLNAKLNNRCEFNVGNILKLVDILSISNPNVLFLM